MKRNKWSFGVVGLFVLWAGCVGCASPTAAEEYIPVTTIVASGNYSLILKRDGSLWGCGTIAGSSPAALKAPRPLLAGFSSVAAGSLGLKQDGSLWAWGGTPPVQVLTGVSAMASGENFSLAVKQDGSLWAWGDNSRGQIGDGTMIRRLSPLQVLTDVSAVSAGSFQVLALKKDGSLWAWGNDVLSPVQVLTGVSAMAAGGSHVLALKPDGTLWAWGQNFAGQLGDGTTTPSDSPVQVLNGVVAVAASDNHSLAIKKDGSLWAWGDDSRGQLGIAASVMDCQHDLLTKTSYYCALPVHVLWNVSTVATSSLFSLALRQDGSLWAWGSNSFGQLCTVDIVGGTAWPTEIGPFNVSGS